MKTAGRETPNRWAKVSSNRANGAVRQNTSCSFKWAEKQENFQPSDECFFLTSPFIEHLPRTCPLGVSASWRSTEDRGQSQSRNPEPTKLLHRWESYARDSQHQSRRLHPAQDEV